MDVRVEVLVTKISLKCEPSVTFVFREFLFLVFFGFVVSSIFGFFTASFLLPVLRQRQHIPVQERNGAQVNH